MKVLAPCELDKDSYASIIFDAMKQLSVNWHLVTDSESDDDKPVLERNYVISLVFQMGKNTKDDSNFGTNVFPSGENNKYICENLNEIDKTYTDLYEKKLIRPFEVIPDLVIHASHNPNAGRSNSQYVAIEAKTTKTIGKIAFMRDFFKLNVYLCSLNFENVIYLVVNTSKDRLEKLIHQYFENDFFYQKEKLGNLLLLIQEDKNSSPCTFKLDEKYIETIKSI